MSEVGSLSSLVLPDKRKTFLASAQQVVHNHLGQFLSKRSTDKRQLSREDHIAAFYDVINRPGLATFTHLLPLLLNLNGQPYSILEEHFPFEPFFNVRFPERMMAKSGRQVSKSTTNAASQVLLANFIHNFNTLTVTPLFEQVRKFSSNYVRPFVTSSPFKDVWLDENSVQSVMQRSFSNDSNLFFSFALLDAERVRGIQADRILYDEVQNLDANHIPIINQVMAHSEWEFVQYTGTPKTKDNTIEGLWQQSSQAEWVTPCFNCGKENVASTEYDLYKMIGPYSDQISPERPGTICANPKCRKPINPKYGRWWHKIKGKRWDFAGYHVPQVIMPFHYGSKRKWKKLLSRQAGAEKTTPAAFHNEVLGESYDLGVKLLSETDLKKAACMNENNYDIALERRKDYDFCVIGVDWGGGGEDEVSYTTYGVICYHSGLNKIDVIYGEQSFTPHEHEAEAERARQLFHDFNATLLAHDYTGAGDVRETVLIYSGIHPDRIFPVAYTRPTSQNFIRKVDPTDINPKTYWRLDKSRSIQLLCVAIKRGMVRFYKYDKVDDDNPGLLCHFLALREEKVTSSRAGDIYFISRNPLMPDDFAHSVNIGCAAIWNHFGSYPNLTDASKFQLANSQLNELDPDVNSNLLNEDYDYQFPL